MAKSQSQLQPVAGPQLEGTWLRYWRKFRRSSFFQPTVMMVIAAVAGSALGAYHKRYKYANCKGAPVTNRVIILESVPTADPGPSNFRVQVTQTKPVCPRQMLLRTKWLALDPHLRMLISEPRSEGRLIGGCTVSEVVESYLEGYNPGDLVLGYYGWQEYAIAEPDDAMWGSGKAMRDQPPIMKWDPSAGSPTDGLGILGPPGLTAYIGLLTIAKVVAGETVVVGAASGAVGQLAGQLAKLQGCRVIGITGSAQKCAYVVDELGFDACIDRKDPDRTLSEALAAAVPDGIDVYLEGVGGDVSDAVLPLLKLGARVPVTGAVSQYNRIERVPPERQLVLNGLHPLGQRKGTRVSKEGYKRFSWGEPAYLPQHQQALERLKAWAREGKLKYRENVTEGLENTAAAFIGMLQGENLGRTLVKIS